MQAGRARQIILKDPTKAREIYQIIDAAAFCEGYYQIYAKYFDESILVNEDINNRIFRDIVFDTKERKDAYWKYDSLLSGYTYSTPNPKEAKKLCDFNTTKFEKIQ